MHTCTGRPHPIVIPQAFPNDPCPLPSPGLGTPSPSASPKPGYGCSGVSYQLKHLFLSPTFPDTLNVFLPSICTSNQSTYDTDLLSLTPPYAFLKVEAIAGPPLSPQHIVGATNSFLQTSFSWSHFTRDPLRFE